jgi:hypothetical protein
LKILKIIKLYISRSTTSQKQLQNQPQFPFLTINVTIQHGIINIQFSINKSDQAKEWIDKLYINISSIITYKAKLTAFVDFHITDTQLKDHKIDSLRKYKRKKKQRSKKIIKLKVIDSDIINEYYN